MQLNVENFKRGMSRFATGITVITTNSKKSTFLGITINSFNSVSLNPLLVLFSLDKSTSIYEDFLQQNKFTVSILNDKQQEICDVFTKPSLINWNIINYSLSTHNQLPIIDNAIAYVDCEIYQSVDAGDHTILIGKVLHLEVLNNEENPLIYFKHGFHKITKGEKI